MDMPDSDSSDSLYFMETFESLNHDGGAPDFDDEDNPAGDDPASDDEDNDPEVMEML
jgi:hypothetical protein